MSEMPNQESSCRCEKLYDLQTDPLEHMALGFLRIPAPSAKDFGIKAISMAPCWAIRPLLPNEAFSRSGFVALGIFARSESQLSRASLWCRMRPCRWTDVLP